MIRRTVGRKLTTAVILTVLLIIGVFAYFNIRTHSRSLLAEVERHAVQVSQTVKSSTEYDMLMDDPDRIHETIKRLGREESIERIRIMNKAGKIIYSSDPQEIKTKVDSSAESCIRCHSVEPPLERLEMKARTRVFRRPGDSCRMLGVITPIYNQDACWTAECHEHPKSQTVLGVFDVIMPLAGVESDIRRSRIEVLVFALSAVLVLSVVLGLFVRRWVSMPVKQLVEATRQVADGNLNKTIDEERADELGQLARSFNHMTRKLSDARMQLVQSDKLASLGRLAAGVAHEINNPLTGVLTYSSLLLKRAKSEEQEDLKVIVRETIRCRDIVKSLLDFARQSVPTKRESDLNEIIRRSISVVEKQLSARKVAITHQLAQDLPKAVVDPNQIEQVLINLIVNAGDAIGPSGGTITVATSALKLSPVGVVQIKQAICPKRHSLIDAEVRFDGKPSVCIKARADGHEGLVHIDPLYGKAQCRHGFEVDERKKTQFVCPDCSTSLVLEGRSCPTCGAAIFAFESPPRGVVEICTRAACGWQRWPEVEAAGPREYVEIRVMDTGCGMDAETLQKIFEPFYSTKGAKGTGLGLAVAWGIVDSHNGSIHVQSAPGQGSTFTIRIPVKP